MEDLKLLVEKTAEAVKDWDSLNKFGDSSLASEERSKFYELLGTKYYKNGNYELATTALLRTNDPREYGEMFENSLKNYKRDVPKKRSKDLVAGIRDIEYVLGEIYANNHKLSLQTSKSSLDTELLEETVDLMADFIKAKEVTGRLSWDEATDPDKHRRHLFSDDEKNKKYHLKLYWDYQKHSNHLFSMVADRSSAIRSSIECDFEKDYNVERVQTFGRILSKELSLFYNISGLLYNDGTDFKTKLKEDLVKCCEYMITNSKHVDIVGPALDWLKQCDGDEEPPDRGKKFTESVIKHYKEFRWDSKIREKLSNYIPSSKRDQILQKEGIIKGITNGFENVAEALPTKNPVSWTVMNTLFGGAIAYTLLDLFAFRQFMGTETGGMMCCASGLVSGIILAVYDFLEWDKKPPTEV